MQWVRRGLAELQVMRTIQEEAETLEGCVRALDCCKGQKPVWKSPGASQEAVLTCRVAIRG